MKLKQGNRYISIILLLLMVFQISFTNLSFALEIEEKYTINIKKNQIDIIDEAFEIAEDLTEEELTNIVLKKNFDSMPPEMKRIFVDKIQLDDELVDFHKKNIDSDFKVENKRRSKRSSNGTIDILVKGLKRIGLPKVVRYALTQWGVSLLAPLADGPLPVGDLIALGDSLITAIVVGWYWDDIKKDKDEIIEVFEEAYEDSYGKASKNIKKALKKMFYKAEKKERKNSKNPDFKISSKAKKDAEKKLGKSGAKKFEEAGKKGIVGSKGQDGIKKLEGRKNKKYKFELKIKKSDYRMGGWVDDDGEIIFDVFTTHKGINRLK